MGRGFGTANDTLLEERMKGKYRLTLMQPTSSKQIHNTDTEYNRRMSARLAEVSRHYLNPGGQISQ